MNQSFVSIREVQRRLSHYLRLSRNGEAVVITNRGVPVGRILPLAQDSFAPDLQARIR